MPELARGHDLPLQKLQRKANAKQLKSDLCALHLALWSGNLCVQAIRKRRTEAHLNLQYFDMAAVLCAMLAKHNLRFDGPASKLLRVENSRL